MTISTSVWSAQHQNAGRNIQQIFFFKCKHIYIILKIFFKSSSLVFPSTLVLALMMAPSSSRLSKSAQNIAQKDRLQICHLTQAHMEVHFKS